VGHHGSTPPQIARPPPSSLQLLASEAPFDGRTNYRDEFTGRRDESGSIQQTVAPDGAASVLGSVLQLYDVHFTLFFKNYTAKKYKKTYRNGCTNRVGQSTEQPDTYSCPWYTNGTRTLTLYGLIFNEQRGQLTSIYFSSG